MNQPNYNLVVIVIPYTSPFWFILAKNLINKSREWFPDQTIPAYIIYINPMFFPPKPSSWPSPKPGISWLDSLRLGGRHRRGDPGIPKIHRQTDRWVVPIKWQPNHAARLLHFAAYCIQYIYIYTYIYIFIQTYLDMICTYIYIYTYIYRYTYIWYIYSTKFPWNCNSKSRWGGPKGLPRMIDRCGLFCFLCWLKL